MPCFAFVCIFATKTLWFKLFSNLIIKIHGVLFDLKVFLLPCFIRIINYNRSDNARYRQAPHIIQMLLLDKSRVRNDRTGLFSLNRNWTFSSKQVMTFQDIPRDIRQCCRVAWYFLFEDTHPMSYLKILACGSLLFLYIHLIP